MVLENIQFQSRNCTKPRRTLCNILKNRGEFNNLMQQMEKKIFLVLVAILLQSCSFPSYVFDNRAQTIGVDFTKGKWLLNEIDAPYDLTKKLTELAINDFSKNLDERINYIPDTKGLLLPQKKIELNPNKTTLMNLQKGTLYDYFINIKAGNTKNDFSSLDLTNHKFNKGGQNINEVTIEIYDLNNLEIIYSQKVIASVSLPKDNQDVHFSKPSSNLILGAYRKLINDINKKSIH